MADKEIFDTETLAGVGIAMKDKEAAAVEKELAVSDKLPAKEVQVSGEYMPLDLSNVFDLPEDHRFYLPQQARALYGCIHCEWRGTRHCPYKLAGGDVVERDTGSKDTHSNMYGEFVPKANTHANGICDYRVNYLKMLTGDWAKRPSFADWQNRLQKARAEVVNSKDLQRYLDLQSELDDAEKELAVKQSDGIAGDIDYRLVEIKKKEVQLARSAWLELWEKVGNRMEKQVDRETPKQVKMDITRTPTMQEIQSAISRFDKGEAVDADYEIIEDEVIKDDN